MWVGEDAPAFFSFGDNLSARSAIRSGIGPWCKGTMDATWITGRMMVVSLVVGAALLAASERPHIAFDHSFLKRDSATRTNFACECCRRNTAQTDKRNLANDGVPRLACRIGIWRDLRRWLARREQCRPHDQRHHHHSPRDPRSVHRSSAPRTDA